MSYFSKVVTVSKNTSSDRYISDTLAIQSGVIHRIHISIPAGHAGLTGIRLLQGLHQIAPVSGSEWFIGDDTELDYIEFIEVDETPFELGIQAFNLDDTYNHSFVVGVGVLQREVLLPTAGTPQVMQGISEILSGMAKWFGVGGRS